MSPALPRVAIIYLSFHCEPYLGDLVPALEKVTYPRDRWTFVVVDNPHPTHGYSADAITKELLAKSSSTLPEVIHLPQETNLGFSGGNNAGIHWALAHDFDYIYLLNNDALPEPGFLEPIVATLEQDRRIGCAQSLLTLYPQTHLLNSSGNAFHFLGYGYSNEYLSPRSERRDTASIHYASGAGVLLRADLLRAHGLWDEDFWMYHEDLEYSFRLRMLGYEIVCVPDSVVGHKYEFSRSISKYFYMERNRFAVLLMFYRIPTLILLLPALACVELASILFAIKGGWYKEKLRASAAWLLPSTWRVWLPKRARIQKARVISDRVLITRASTGAILFQGADANNVIVQRIANPLLCAYRTVMLWVMFW